MSKRLILIVFVVIYYIPFIGYTQGGDTLLPFLQKTLPAQMAEYNVPCVGVGLIQDGRIAWVKIFGSLGKDVPAPSNTLFNIASQTKPVTAMLVLRLVQAGLWNLDEPLAHYWIDPDIAGQPWLYKLTTRVVLSHRTGFPNWRSNDSSGRLSFHFEPGTQFGYSGEGFEYLRRALESKFHQPLNKLMDVQLFKPLGMKNTGYWSANLDTTRFAMWHDGKGHRYQVSIQTPVNAADDLITTVEDYCKLGVFVLQGAGLTDTLYQQMIQPLVRAKEHYYRGLGWGLVKDLPGGGFALEHGGSDIGVRTMAIFLPNSKEGIVVMTNGDNGLFISDKIIKAALPTGAAILGIMNKGAQTHERITLADTLIQSYTGVYQQSNGKVMNVVKEGNAIKVSGDGVPTAVLYPETDTRFFLPDYDVQLEFGRVGTADAGTLTIYENGKQVMRISRANL